MTKSSDASVSPAATLKGAFLFVLTVFATPVNANELWVAPAKGADKLSADFAVAQRKAHFGFGVPDNFNGFTRATVLLIGSRDQQISYDVALSISQHGGSHAAAVAELKGMSANVFKDQLLELDVSAVFNGAPALLPGTDYVSLSWIAGRFMPNCSGCASSTRAPRDRPGLWARQAHRGLRVCREQLDRRALLAPPGALGHRDRWDRTAKTDRWASRVPKVRRGSASHGEVSSRVTPPTRHGTSSPPRVPLGSRTRQSAAA